MDDADRAAVCCAICCSLSEQRSIVVHAAKQEVPDVDVENVIRLVREHSETGGVPADCVLSSIIAARPPIYNTKGTTGSSRLRVTGYRLQEESSEWVILEEHMHFLVMRLARAKAELCSTGGHVLFRLTPHVDFEFTEMEPRFIAVMLNDHCVLGLRFDTDSDVEVFLKQLLHIHFLSNLMRECDAVQETLESAWTEDGDRPPLVVQGCALEEYVVLLCSSVLGRGQLKTLSETCAEQFVMSPNEETLREVLSNCNAKVMQQRVPTSIEFWFGQIPRALSLLLRTFEDSTSFIFTTILTEVRVVIVGDDSDSVLRCCIGAALLVSPLELDIARTLFPCVSDIDLQKLALLGRSFVAGVSRAQLSAMDTLFNGDAAKWYDVLCDIDNGTVHVDESLEAQVGQSLGLDAKSESSLVYSAKAGFDDEYLLKSAQDRVSRVLRTASDKSVYKSAAQQEFEVASNSWRINAWTGTYSHEHYERSQNVSSLSTDVQLAVKRLLNEDAIPDADLTSILEVFVRSINTTADRVKLVKLLKDEGGSSDNIAAMMLHRNRSIRQLAVRTVFKCRLLDPSSAMSSLFRGVYERNNTDIQ